MPLVKINGIDNSLYCLVNRGIFKNNIGSFTTEFQGCFFIGSGNSPLNNFSNIG